MSVSETPFPPTALERFAAQVMRANGYLLTTLAFFLVVCVVWQVLSRYVTPRPSTMTDELARFSFMWIGLLGAAQATALKQHLAIDLMAMKLTGNAKKNLDLFIEVVIIVFAVLVLIYGGWQLTAKTFANNQVTPALQWPMGYVYMAVPIAGVLMVFFAVVEIIRILRGRASQGG